MSKPRIITSCVANQYTEGHERIVEFSDEGGGGLIALRRLHRPGEHVRLMVHVYRCDPTVDVHVGKPDEDGLSLDAHRTAVALAEEGLRRLLLFTHPASDEAIDLNTAAATVTALRHRVEKAVDDTWLSGLPR